MMKDLELTISGWLAKKNWKINKLSLEIKKESCKTCKKSIKSNLRYTDRDASIWSSKTWIN
jgi:hypothetical protein